jgi:hypothetical protein
MISAVVEADRLHCLFIGAGPGGMGPLVCALQRGELPQFLARGIAVADAGERMGSGRLGSYALRSDSLAGAFLECLDAAPARALLGPLRERAHVRELAALRATHAPLALVARLLDDIGAELQGELARHGTSRFLARHTAETLTALSNGGWRVGFSCAGSRQIELEARSVVLALGGAQDLGDAARRPIVDGLRLEERWGAKLALSDELVTRTGREQLRARLRAGGAEARVVILGGSHSAFSVAWVVLEEAHDLALAPGAVTLLPRGRVRVFYPTPEEARREGYTDVTANDVCPVTGRAHRLGGLRGDGRELARRVLGLGGAPSEPRVALHPLETFARDRAGLARLFDAATLIVPAFGYRARTLPALAADGNALALGLADGSRLVDDEARVLDARGAPLAGLFSLGLATGYVPAGEKSFRGHTNGVWLYQNDTGARILRQVGA